MAAAYRARQNFRSPPRNLGVTLQSGFSTGCVTVNEAIASKDGHGGEAGTGRRYIPNSALSTLKPAARSGV